jgi:hypothetical protein
MLVDKMEARREAVYNLLRERYLDRGELWMSNGTKGTACIQYVEALVRGQLFLPNAAVDAYHEVFEREFPMRLQEMERFTEEGWLTKGEGWLTKGLQQV